MTCLFLIILTQKEKAAYTTHQTSYQYAQATAPPPPPQIIVIYYSDDTTVLVRPRDPFPPLPVIPLEHVNNSDKH